MNTALVDQMEEWIERGPFRTWRKKNGLSIRKAAGVIGVSSTTIQGWENGATFPNSENMVALIDMTRDTEFPEKWKDWYREGPTDG